MKERKNWSLRSYVGVFLCAVCTVECLIDMLLVLAQGDGITMLGDILSAIAIGALGVTTIIHHDSEKMAQWPSVMMCAVIGLNVLFIFSKHWTHVFMLVPLGVFLFMLLAQPEQGILGIITGASMFLLNLIAGVIAGKGNSFALAKFLVNVNSLMGIACMCLFCSFPKTWAYGRGDNQPEENENNNDDMFF